MKIEKYLLFVAIALASTSCEKVIEVDLNEADPQLVIEAKLESGEHDFEVIISETSSYFVNEAPTYRDEAIVTLINGDGQEQDIPWQGNGRYHANVEAIPGEVYTLQVEVEGQLYQATAEVPTTVPLIELEAEFQESSSFFDAGYRIFSRFADDPGRANYYRVIHAVDGEYQLDGEDLQVSDDRLFDGSERARLPIFQRTFEPGATITLVLQHIDQSSFDYLNSLSDIIGDGQGPNSGSAAPGNPISNWSGDVLGYFGAYSADTLSIELPE